MSLVQTSTVDCVPQRTGTTSTTTTTINAIITAVDQPPLSSKRKLDDYGDDENDDVFSEFVSVRMRKDEPNPTQSSSRLQFFIRMISEGKTMVIQANTHDTVRSVHDRIQLHTGIPVHEQRLI
jgi:hypothetical protein